MVIKHDHSLGFIERGYHVPSWVKSYMIIYIVNANSKVDHNNNKNKICHKYENVKLG
jgi:hypothetical protein